jgi:hypothetical protein
MASTKPPKLGSRNDTYFCWVDEIPASSAA